MKASQSVYVAGSLRIPFAKSMTAYKNETRKALLAETMKKLVFKYNLNGKQVGDVALGCLMNGSADWNLAREVVLETALHPETPAYNLQRACGTSLDATWQIALKIAAGQIETGIAGGVDTNSDLPIEVSNRFQHILLEANQAKTLGDRLKIFLQLRPTDLKPRPAAVVEPRTGLSMGDHCELMVKEWGISRVSQDELTLRSHKNAAAAYKSGFFNDLITPYAGVEKDLIVRDDTTMEKLAKLKPAFDRSPTGTLTAGNSSPLTDGSSAVILSSAEGLKKNGWQALAKVVDFEAAAVDFVNGAGLLMAPTIAVSKMLQRNNLTFKDIDFFEIHEAFAGQVLCTLKAWESEKYCKEVLKRDAPLGPIPVEKINIMGSSVAVGHPFAATGTRIVGTLAKILSTTKGKRGLISICTAGGMGVVALLESPDLA